MRSHRLARNVCEKNCRHCARQTKTVILLQEPIAVNESLSVDTNDRDDGLSDDRPVDEPILFVRATRTTPDAAATNADHFATEAVKQA